MTLGERQAQTKPLAETVDLCKELIDGIEVGLSDAATRIPNGEANLIVGLIDSKRDVLPVGILDGVVQELLNTVNHRAAVGAHTETLGQMGMIINLDVREKIIGIVEHFFHRVGNIHIGHLQRARLCPTRIRAVEEHEHHAQKLTGVVVHSASNILKFVNRQAFAFQSAFDRIIEQLSEAHDDVKRRTNLVGNILYEIRLLLLALDDQLRGLIQFLIVLQLLLSSLMNTIDVVV